MSVFISFLLFLFPQNINQFNQELALSAEETKAINEYVDYFNESIHGMLIIHRLLENNNQDINKYVDLDGYQINFYTNNDLPKNIFEDPEQWFYEVSPEKRFQNLKAVQNNLPAAIKSDLISQSSTIHSICTSVNSIRFEVEKYIDEHDLTVREELYGVYELLEKAVDLYSNFYATQNSFQNSIKPYTTKALEDNKDDSFMNMYRAFMELHTNSKNILHALRIKDEAQISKLNKELKTAYANFETQVNSPEYAGKYNKNLQYSTIQTKVKDVIKAADEFESGNIPVEYKLYGKYYYFHNSNVINKFNKYGNGFVNEMNKLSDKQNSLFPHFLEVPHYFQVIYPMKIIEQDYIVSESEMIDAVPTTIENRDVVVNENVIKAETNLLEIELYDYKLKDNDIVSVNFNGDWIFKNLSLETEPKKLKLKLNDTGVNYLLIQAESVGIISPNTVAIKYKIGLKRDEIILESDLNSSALIEFSVDN